MQLNSSVRENGEIIITSGDRLTIENATEFAHILSESLASASVVVLEFEPAVEIDISGMQIICSACKSAAAGGKVFSYHGLQPQALATLIASSGAERHAVCKHNNDSTCIWFGGAN